MDIFLFSIGFMVAGTNALAQESCPPLRQIEKAAELGSDHTTDWAQAWQVFLDGEWELAHFHMTNIAIATPFGPQTPAALYWGAVAAERMGDYPAARQALHQVVAQFPIDYYAYRADQHLQSLAQGTTSPETHTYNVLSSRWTLRDGSFVTKSCKRRARRELQKQADRLSSHAGPEDLVDLETMARQLESQYVAARFKNARLARFPTTDAPSKRALRRQFPKTYTKTVERAALRVGIDPGILVGLAKQESGFKPNAVSAAGAVGLMQLLPSTANELIGKRYSALQTQKQLLDPYTNALLGARYLRKMLNHFDDNVEYALAAYNAGPGRVRRWRRNFNHPASNTFVEQIPYNETRNYVRGVLQGKRQYDLLTGRNTSKLAPNTVSSYATETNGSEG